MALVIECTFPGTARRTSEARATPPLGLRRATVGSIVTTRRKVCFQEPDLGPARQRGRAMGVQDGSSPRGDGVRSGLVSSPTIECRVGGAQGRSSRLWKERLLRVRRRNRDDRLFQRHLGPSTTDRAHVAEPTAVVSVDRLDLGMMVGTDGALPGSEVP